MRRRAGVVMTAAFLVSTLVLTLSACSAVTGGIGRDQARRGQPTAVAPGTGSSYDKVLLLVEEDKSFAEVMDRFDTPYLHSLAAQHGLATQMQAGYPIECPGLPAYLLLTSGDTHQICDDRDPTGQWLDTPNLFEQVASAGLQWRGYAESMPAPCTPVNSGRGVFLVRHTPAVYYSSERQRCRNWQLPLGTPQAGAFQADLAAGLPAFSMVTPDACHNWQGLPPCPENAAVAGDDWLSTWVPRILQSPDYTSGRLVVIITWDEGSETDNHIATVVLSPTTQGVASAQPYTHCSTLRTIEEILGLPLIGCAAAAPSMRVDFGL